MRVHFVIPAYNEAASIGDLIRRIAEVCGETSLDYDVLVVDDGSDDETGALALEAGGASTQVIRNERNMGLGASIRRGLGAAADAAADADAIVTLDADLTQNPAYVPAMLARLTEGADVVIASRFRPGAGVEGLGPVRRLLSSGASVLVALVRPIPGVRDYSCGFRAYRAEVLKRAFAALGDGLVTESGFACMVELAERLRGHATFAEVPFVLRYHEKRKPSAIRIWPTIRAYLRVLARVSREDTEW